MKHVFYKELRGWALTPENNYYPMIADANKITILRKDVFPTREDAYKYIIEILKLRPDMLIDKTRRL